MKTPEQLTVQMLATMPYVLNANVIPYLFELVELAQNEAYNQALYDLANDDLLPDKERNIKLYMKK